MSHKTKWKWFQLVAVSELMYNCTIYTLTKRLEKKPDEKYSKGFVEILEATPHQAAAIRPLIR